METASTIGSATLRATDAESEVHILARVGTDVDQEPSSFLRTLVYVVVMSARPTIEHDPHEPKIDRRPESFRLMFIVVAIAWGCLLYSYNVDFLSVGLGAFTGMIFMLWASVRFKHLW
ncbi:hypothetical protein [Sinorhizobium meliloti]|uniref:hypothetical protein n=1 Tax=Rhizobium meliloti TaxID=382 RepID=UPI001F30F118|nr:hypothetical protein [Sinorhizobium meliloti]